MALTSGVVVGGGVVVVGVVVVVGAVVIVVGSVVGTAVVIETELDIWICDGERIVEVNTCVCDNTPVLVNTSDVIIVEGEVLTVNDSVEDGTFVGIILLERDVERVTTGSLLLTGPIVIVDDIATVDKYTDLLMSVVDTPIVVKPEDCVKYWLELRTISDDEDKTGVKLGSTVVNDITPVRFTTSEEDIKVVAKLGPTVVDDIMPVWFTISEAVIKVVVKLGCTVVVDIKPVWFTSDDMKDVVKPGCTVEDDIMPVWFTISETAKEVVVKLGSTVVDKIMPVWLTISEAVINLVVKLDCTVVDDIMPVWFSELFWINSEESAIVWETFIVTEGKWKSLVKFNVKMPVAVSVDDSMKNEVKLFVSRNEDEITSVELTGIVGWTVTIVKLDDVSEAADIKSFDDIGTVGVIKADILSVFISIDEDSWDKT